MDEEWEWEEDESHINTTPIVNVSLVLVMIFLVTSPYFVKDLIPVLLPKAVTSETESEENITISISPSEGYAINEVPIDKNHLAFNLESVVKRSGLTYVLIRADQRVPHGEVEDIMKMSRKVGIKRISFATVPKL
ncbi:hypothetical protein BVX98_00995 [bacterium F11]|nr:hypothetical protein BVX98_00995 [bacterium F11]